MPKENKLLDPKDMTAPSSEASSLRGSYNDDKGLKLPIGSVGANEAQPDRRLTSKFGLE